MAHHRIAAPVLLLLLSLRFGIALAQEPSRPGGEGSTDQQLQQESSASTVEQSESPSASDQQETPASPPLAVERQETASPEDIQSYEALYQRYDERMSELLHDIESFVQQQEEFKRRQVTESFGQITDSLKKEEIALRNLARDRFTTYLQKYPDSEYTPHVLFRLSELEFEEAETHWLAETESYSRSEASLSPAELETLPPPPLKDYSKPIALYRRILENYPDYERIDGVYYMLGYCFSEVNAQQYDPATGREALSVLLERFPGSEFANDANLRLGEYYFENNDIAQAISHYQRIVDNGEEARYYDKGLYKLAWSHFKLADLEHIDEYKKALELFTTLLDYSRRMLASRGEESAMEPEAIQYVAISFADMADTLKKSPTDLAESFFDVDDPKPYEPDIFEALAEILVQQARWEEAIKTYRYMQDRWPLLPGNPQYQYRIAQLYMNMPVPDPEASAQAQRELALRYNDRSQWWEANSNRPDALEVASGFMQQAMSQVAMDLHIKAQQSNTPEDYSLAADSYKEFLTRFPFVDNYYEMLWYLADTLYEAGRLTEAEREYQRLASSQGHPYRDGALFRLMQTRRRTLVDKYGKVEARPESAQLEQTLETPFGQTVNVYQLTPAHEAFIEAADQVVATEFTDQVYAEYRQKNLAALRYLPAQILYEFGHLAEARERFFKIIELFPKEDEAAFSAGLIVRSFQDEGDLRKVRLYTGKYSRQPLGRSEEALAKAEQFASLEEGAAFQLAFNLIEKGDRHQAATEFLKFIEDFPDSEHVRDALFNAANNLEIVGQADQANRLFEQYINSYPSDERSKGLYFRIASNYASILELEKAITYYEALVQNFPDAIDAPAALFNAAFLRIGLGDNRGAAQDFEAYAIRYPDQPDAESTFFLAGERWEKLDENEALSFYRRYLQQYSGVNADRTIEAQHHIIKILEGKGNDRQAEKEWQVLGQTFQDLSASGELGPMARRLAAEAEFRQLWSRYEQYSETNYTGDEQQDAIMLMETKPAELKAIEDQCLSLIQTYQDAFYSSAAIFIQAAAYYEYVDMLFDAPPPQGFNEEQIGIYEERLQELAEPIEQKARARAEANLDKARKEKFWTEWQARTLNLLNKRYPKEFPRERTELHLSTNILSMPDPGAVEIPIPELEPEATTTPGQTDASTGNASTPSAEQRPTESSQPGAVGREPAEGSRPGPVDQQQ